MPIRPVVKRALETGSGTSTAEDAPDLVDVGGVGGVGLVTAGPVGLAIEGCAVLNETGTTVDSGMLGR